MGHERLSSGTRSHAPSERLAGGAHRSQISLPLVLLSLHALLGLVWNGVVCELTDLLSGPSGDEWGLMAQMARITGKHMARIIGYAAVPVMVGPILGPVFAGAILQRASWRWLFLIDLPVGVLAIVLAVLFLPNDREL
jgi:MFS family permease